MATRLYISNTTPGYTPSTFRGTWTYTQTSIGSGKLGPKYGAAATTISTSHGVAGTWNHCSRRYVSEPLTADTTFTSGTDTLSWCFGELVSSVSNTGGKIDIVIFITQGDSDSMRGSILRSNYIGATAFTTSGVGRGDSGVALSNTVNALKGDRICVELGWQKTGTSASGRTSTHNRGNEGGTDLTAGSANVTTEPGWIEFSNDFTVCTQIEEIESLTVAELEDEVITPFFVNVHDDSVVSEYKELLRTEAPCVIDVHDDVRVSEYQGEFVPTYYLNVYDNVEASEYLEGSPTKYFINVVDNAGVSESKTVYPAFYLVNVYDNTRVSEYLDKILPFCVVNAYDGVGVSEYTDRLITKYYLDVYDKAGVSEYQDKLLPVFYVSVYDGNIVTEYNDKLVPAYYADISEGFTVQEFSTASAEGLMPIGDLDKQDLVGVSEAAMLTQVYNISEY